MRFGSFFVVLVVFPSTVIEFYFLWQTKKKKSQNNCFSIFHEIFQLSFNYLLFFFVYALPAEFFYPIHPIQCLFLHSWALIRNSNKNRRAKASKNHFVLFHCSFRNKFAENSFDSESQKNFSAIQTVAIENWILIKTLPALHRSRLDGTGTVQRSHTELLLRLNLIWWLILKYAGTCKSDWISIFRPSVPAWQELSTECGFKSTITVGVE